MARKPERVKIQYGRVAKFEKLIDGRTYKETPFYYNGRTVLSYIPIDNMTNYFLYYIEGMGNSLKREITTLNGIDLIISVMQEDFSIYIINIYLLSEMAYSEEIIRRLLTQEEIKIYKKSQVLEIEKPHFYNGADKIVRKIFGGGNY